MSVYLDIKKMQISRQMLYRVLYLLPILSISDVMSLYEGTLHNHVLYTTPFLIKIIKDVLIIASILYFFRARRCWNDYMFSGIALFWVLSLITLSCIVSYVHWGNFLLLIAGMRWSLPVILLCVLFGAVKKCDLIFIANILRWVFIVHFGFQIMEWVFGGSYYGVAFWGLNARSPGIFVIPNTGGLFTIFCAYMYMYFLDKKRNPFMYIIFALSAFLTGSGTAIVTILLLFFLDKIYLRRKMWLVFFPVVFVGVFALMMFVLSDIRPDSYVQISLGTRLHTLYEYMVSTSLFSKNFGITTNTGVELGVRYAIVADSLYASILGNLGWLGMTGFIFFVFALLYIAEAKKSKELFVFLNIFVIVSFTSIINEAFPMNYLSAILFAYFLRNAVDVRKAITREVYI